MVAKRRLRIWTFAHIAQKSISHTPRKVSVVETAVQIQEWKHRATGRRGASDATISFRTQGCGSADWKLGGWAARMEMARVRRMASLGAFAN